MFAFFILFLLINSLKSCPLTDNYLSRCHCGILTNGDSYIKCEEKTLNQIPTFKRSFPYDELILSNNNITSLLRTSFDNIKTIKRINLENNSLTFIDNDLLRLLGNYLEELILTGDNHINSLEFLIRYPLNNLRILKLNQFDLSEINFEKIFSNMTKLEIIYLRSCQIKQIPNLSNIQILDLENNHISNAINLKNSYIHLNLAQNFISSISLENNSQLKTLNLTQNLLTSFNFSMLNENLTDLNLNYNRLLSIDLNNLPKNLLSLSINNNLLKQIKFSKQDSLSSLDLSYNQIKSIEKNLLFEKLNYLNLENNPLECNCHLEWLKNLILFQNKFNASTWTCLSRKSYTTFLSSNFQCLTKLSLPKINLFNISYVKIASDNGLFIQWSIIDDSNILNSIQISIAEPFYLSPKFHSNQTEIFLSNQIQLNKKYHICLILLHKYARDKYCREFFTDKLIIIPMSNEIILEKTTNRNSMEFNYDINIYMLLIGSCIGGLITFILIFLCCYLCFQIHKFNLKKKNETNLSYYSRNINSHYRPYHSHSTTTCPYHNENLSNSTDSSQIDTSLSTTNLKHIYQTIDNQDYTSFKRENQLFDLWNESIRQKR
ncbi:unnamed protein product [Adineta steineri]|uniref:Uncharacterized protein n=1 Tax=Adineta steineri TaxID=433720 RepID=A0A815IRJ8_9BILA|nr:unnamed protein product [Adineta steineri]